MTADCVRFGLYYDFRRPSGLPYEQVYRENLDQIAWADTAGFDSVWISEHYFTDDGYTPSPMAVASAVAARTARLRIGTNLILLPLHDPLRLAGDAATVSILSDGRFDLGVGLGYRQFEYETFGRDIKHRPSLIEESISILRQAFTGDSITLHGKRFDVDGVRVTPVPAAPPRILIGGTTHAGIDRAARIGDGFLSVFNFFHPMYLDAAAANGASPSITASQWAVIADDPERTWAEVGDFAAYMLNVYASWGAYGPVETAPTYDRETALSAGLFQLWDTSTAVDELSTLLASTPSIEDVHFWARLPGESAASSHARADLMASKVIPGVRSRLVATGIPA
jgi:alkanesulfonate monooxygenase SsuD/methylene tetrahydromethanopterin reductase-like flavin-dependent oxidoreductase (luciferase family)